MSTERRFDEQETAYILEAAAAAEPAASEEGQALTARADRTAPRRGMTVEQLQQIAAEVGLSPVAVADAARAVERGELVPTERRTYAGLPVGVARTITFDRVVTDAEWERLVAALRETFQARGKMQQEGSLRHWSNGNLQALLEPTETGQRLRLFTRKGDAGVMIGMGVSTLLFSGVLAVPLYLASTASAFPWWSAPAIIGTMGGAVLVRALLTLPAWARTRATQMEQFAKAAARIVGP